MFGGVHMIPKVIHYCWFGGNPLPITARDCIESWRLSCPDYEIIEWNESNFDVNAIPYTAGAYKDKKWAYVTDYARLKIVYEHGGIYLDTDVEVLKSLDPFLEHKAFFGTQSPGVVATGLGFGAEAGTELLKELMAGYEHRPYFTENGESAAAVCVEIDHAVFQKWGIKPENRIQRVADATIYPVEYFNPKDYETGQILTTDNSYSIHHYHASWHSKGDARMRRKMMKLIQKYGRVEGKQRFGRWYNRRKVILGVQRHGIRGAARKFKNRLMHT